MDSLRGGVKKTMKKRSGWPLGLTPASPHAVRVLWFFQNKLTYFDLFYHFIMGKIGPKFSHPEQPFRCLDFTLFVIDIHQILLISLFPTPFDHFHFHGSGGLILWYDLRLWHTVLNFIYLTLQITLLLQLSSLPFDISF